MRILKRRYGTVRCGTDAKRKPTLDQVVRWAKSKIYYVAGSEETRLTTANGSMRYAVRATKNDRWKKKMEEKEEIDMRGEIQIDDGKKWYVML